MKSKFTDIHHHILYGMDDGAASAEQMQAMLRKACADNIGRIIATPHVSPGLRRFDRNQFDRALQQARDFCAAEKMDMQILEGSEIFYTPRTCSYLLDERVPTLAGTDFVLVEFSPEIRFESLCDALDDLLENGFRPIIAHTERYACLVHHPRRTERLRRDMGNVYFQVNCSSVISDRGMGSHRFVQKMLRLDLVDALGTDAHNPNFRTVHMTQAWKEISREYGDDYADELTDGSLIFETKR